VGEGRRCLNSEGTFDAPQFKPTVMLDPEIWKIVFEVYARHPTSAFSLAFQLIAVKQSLQQGRKGMQEAMEALDLAIESLYPHTQFHKMGHQLYRRALEGTITLKQEELVRKLGVKF
jgi:hypothetical protein